MRYSDDDQRDQSFERGTLRYRISHAKVLRGLSMGQQQESYSTLQVRKQIEIEGEGRKESGQDKTRPAIPAALAQSL